MNPVYLDCEIRIRLILARIRNSEQSNSAFGPLMIYYVWAKNYGPNHSLYLRWLIRNPLPRIKDQGLYNPVEDRLEKELPLHLISMKEIAFNKSNFLFHSIFAHGILINYLVKNGRNRDILFS